MLSQLTSGAFSHRTGARVVMHEFMERHISAFPCFHLLFIDDMEEVISSYYPP